MNRLMIVVSALCVMIVGCGDPEPQEAKKEHSRVTPQSVLDEYAKEGKTVTESKFDEIKPGIFMGYVIVDGNAKTHFCLMNEDEGMGVSISRISWTGEPKTLEQVIADRDAQRAKMAEKMESKHMIRRGLKTK